MMKFKRTISKFLIFILSFTLLLNLAPKDILADSFKVVTLGANLTKDQKKEMLDYFKVTKNDANILEVTWDEENKYLGKVATKAQLGSRSISCSYVEPKNSGGLQISTYNISWVTEGIIKNALITAGIENAIVKAAAPFKVSGTAALTGILKGFENSSAGEKIDESKKEAANEELVVTGDLGEKIGTDKATAIINEIKKEVIKSKPENTEAIEKIVSNVAKEYNLSLEDVDMKKVTALMNKINGLDLNFDNLKNQLNEVANQFKKILGNEDAKGFFAKIKDFFVKLFKSIKDFFVNLFSNEDSETPKVTSENQKEDIEPKSKETTSKEINNKKADSNNVQAEDSKKTTNITDNN